MFPGLNVTLSSDCNADKTRNVIQECLYMKGAETLPAVKTPTVQRAPQLPSGESTSGTQSDGSQRSVYWEVGAVGVGGQARCPSPGRSRYWSSDACDCAERPARAAATRFPPTARMSHQSLLTTTASPSGWLCCNL